MFYALQARACWSGCMLSRPHSRTPGRSRCACCAQLRTIWHLAARVDSICARRAAIARAAWHCAHFRCSARAYPQQISFVSAHASVFPARAVTRHAQLFMFSMEYLFFLLCARYCQTCARCGLAVRYFPFHCLQVFTGVATKKYSHSSVSQLKLPSISVVERNQFIGSTAMSRALNIPTD